MKYSTFVKRNNLCFQIEEGQFKGISFKYESLTEANGLKYKVLNDKNLLNENNKLLFEREIKNILADKLSHV